jgi:hypothetical protein
MKLNLDQLEAKIQSLVENQLTGMLPGIKLEELYKNLPLL